MGPDKDFSTGKPVDYSKPEEKVRQDFERFLHGDYGYPKNCMDIEVEIQMGSSKKKCDIALYSNKGKRHIVGIIETKSPSVKDGRAKKQLMSYMSATSTCWWGAWTNGEEFEIARKDKDSQKINMDPAYSIPKFGQPDTAKAKVLRYEDLKPAKNLKFLFKIINNRLYANTNLPRSEKQGAEMVRLIFCKLTDEYNSRDNNETPKFQIFDGESNKATRKRINELWEKTKTGWVGAPIFDESEKIKIDDYSLRLIVNALHTFSLLKTKRDAVGDAFEHFHYQLQTKLNTSPI